MDHMDIIIKEKQIYEYEHRKVRINYFNWLIEKHGK